MCGFNHKLSRQPSPSTLIPRTSRAPHSGRLPRREKTPGPRSPRAPPALPASRAADSKLALAASAQVISKAPGTPRRPPTSGPALLPQTAFTCLHGPVGALESRAERLSSAAAAEPQFPKELIPVAGGGGAEGRSRRRRKGREVSAAIPARESAQGRTEQEKKESHPSPGLSRRRGAEAQRPGRMAEVGGEGPPAATLCLPLPWI